MDFSDEQKAFIAHHLNELLRVTNKGKNDAWKKKNGDLAAAFLAQNMGARELAAAILEDDTITDPEQCPFLIL